MAVPSPYDVIHDSLPRPAPSSKPPESGVVSTRAVIRSGSSDAAADSAPDSADVDFAPDSANVDSAPDSANVDFARDSADVDFARDSADVNSAPDSADVDFAPDSEEADFAPGAGLGVPFTAIDAIVRPRLAAPQDAARPTRAEIDLGRVRYNYQQLRACLNASASDRPPAQLWAVLKADAYGHGARSVATTLERAGVSGICVALLEEGIELRNAGIRSPILVMGGAFGRYREGMEALITHGLTPVVYDADQVERLANAVAYLNRRSPLPVHVKVDTGMGRLGARGSEVERLLEALRAAPGLRVEGLMTHLACAADEDWAASGEQLRQFRAAERQLRAHGFAPTVRHAANSAALIRWPATHFDLARPGISLFGVHPCRERTSAAARPPKLKPVMRVVSEIVALRDVEVGAGVGYGHAWRATRPSRLGTIPMGYADGLPWSAARGGQMLVSGKRAPIVGAISMDLVTVDLTGHPGVRVHDEVVVLGAQSGRLGADCIDAEEIATRAGTIAYEVLTNISRRVPRFYRRA